MKNLLEHVERSIRNRKLVRRDERILVAVSGGVDSMVLLYLLHAIAAKIHWKLFVAHFNHQLRGRSSDADERFVHEAATALRLKFFSARADVRKVAEEHAQSIEMAARELRHEFFARSACKLKCRVVTLAHHADDQVELFFLRLLRGAGSEGIAGMKWTTPSPANSAVQLVRPLLDVTKSELERYARENKIPFREDASNAALDFRRNRVRHRLLPRLRREFSPSLDRTILRVMEIVGAEAEWVTQTAEEWLRQRKRCRFDDLLLAIQRRCLHLQLLRLKVAADFETIESLRREPGRPVSIGPKISVLRDRAGIIQTRSVSSATFNQNELVISLDDGVGEVIFDGVRCQWRVASGGSHRKPYGRQCECFDADAVGSQIVLRHWRAGDRFQPIGMSKPVKLQDWFTNQKIPRSRRHQLLVAMAECGGIFWVEGLRIGERFKLTNRTRRGLIWRWKRS